MKYTISKEQERLFFGESRLIDLKDPSTMKFGDVWSDTMKHYNPDNETELYDPIGLEIYDERFPKDKVFTYSALLPIKSKEGIDPKLIRTIPAGTFLKFEMTYKELYDGQIPKIYEYIHNNQINVQYGFDYEEYPKGFDYQNENSIVYLCIRQLD